MKLKNKKIAFIGAGKMAEALIKGLVSSKVIPPKKIYASDVLSKRLKLVKSRYKVNTLSSNEKAVKAADIIVLAVKPQLMGIVLKKIGPHVRRNQLVVSIAAGIKTKSIKKFVGKASVVRVMPNNPCLIGEGVCAIAGSASNKKIVESIFSSVSEVVYLDESQMDAVTAVSGSGPAFVYYLAEAFIEGAKKAGLKGQVAEKLTMRTLIGAAKTLIETGESPERLRAMVASPGGTTLAGLKVLSKYKFKKALVSAIMSATKRSGQLGKVYNP